MIVVNFKSYHESTNLNAVKLAKICEEASIETGVNIIVCPNAFDLKEVRSHVNIDVYAQHVDSTNAGPHTGFLPAFLARAKGADGTLLNHSEHKLDWNTLVETVSKVKEEGMGSILCAESVEYAVRLVELFPNEIALEIPELISGNISIAKANPLLIKEAVKRIGENKILAGAGIRTADDIKAALDMGVKGVILASSFDLAENPKKIITSFAKAFI